MNSTLHDDIYTLGVPCRSPTALYGMPPKGLGTGQVESLHSYFFGLAAAHLVNPANLLDVLFPGTHTGANKSSNLEWCSEFGKVILSPSMSAARWLRAISLATGRNDLACTQLSRFGALVNGISLLRTAPQHCAECFTDDLKRGQAPYWRLLWHIKEVTCCPIHNRSLIETRCDISAHSKRKVVSFAHPATCGYCGSIGHSCCKNRASRPTPGDLWKSQQIEDLLRDFPDATAPTLGEVKRKVYDYIQNSPRGYCGMAQRAQMPKSQLWEWVRTPTTRFSLAHYLSLAAGEGWSLNGMLTCDMSTVGPRCHVSRSRLKANNGPIDYDRVRLTLQDALTRDYPPSVNQVIRELRVSGKQLREKLPELVCKLRDRYLRASTRMAVERYERAVREAYLTATALKCAGLKLTLRNASEINGRQWYPSSLAWQALFLFREELPPLNKMSVRKRRHVNPTFLSMIEAQRRRLYKMKGYPFSSSSGKITGWMSRY